MTGQLYCFSIAEEVGLSISRDDSNSCSKKAWLARGREIFRSHFFIEIISFFSPLGLAKFALHLQVKRMDLGYPRKLGSELCLCQALWAWWSLFISEEIVLLAQQGKCNTQMSELLEQRGLSRKSYAKPNGGVEKEQLGLLAFSLCLSMAVGKSLGQTESSLFFLVSCGSWGLFCW